MKLNDTPNGVNKLTEDDIRKETMLAIQAGKLFCPAQYLT